MATLITCPTGPIAPSTVVEQPPASLKRKLLRFLVEEYKWTKGSLTYKWEPPFERVAEVEEAKAA
jgi:hypothetical protein